MMRAGKRVLRISDTTGPGRIVLTQDLSNLESAAPSSSSSSSSAMRPRSYAEDAENDEKSPDDDDGSGCPLPVVPIAAVATVPPLPTASRGYSAPGRSPASTTAAGAIVPTVVEVIYVRLRKEREGKGQKVISLFQVLRSRKRKVTTPGEKKTLPSCFSLSRSTVLTPAL